MKLSLSFDVLSRRLLREVRGGGQSHAVPLCNPGTCTAERTCLDPNCICRWDGGPKYKCVYVF